MLRYPAALTLILLFLSVVPASAARLDDVKKRGEVVCAAEGNLAGFSVQDGKGQWTGMDADFCRALASAIFNDPTAVRFEAAPGGDSVAALKSGAVDVVPHSQSWTMGGDAGQGVSFVGTLFFDGQAFLVKASSGAKSVHDLSDAKVCLSRDGNAELNVADYFTSNNMNYQPTTVASNAEAIQSFFDGRCDTVTAPISALAAARSVRKDAADYVILPETISKQPLPILVADGDDQWFKIVRWVYFALLDADELGVTQVNVDEMLGSDNPEIKRLLGVEGDFGSPLGLTKDWAYRIVKGTGNYGELFDRHIGPNSPLALQPGLNALWRDGGIQYAPPIR